MRLIKMPVKGAKVYDKINERGYMSVRSGKMYHKFFDTKSYEKWLETGLVRCAWGESVWELLKRSGYDVC